MRTALVTGGKRGIGKEVADYLRAEGYRIIDYSKSGNGDISKPEVQERVLKDLEECSVFVNNAHSGYAQVQLLAAAFEKWHHLDRFILNIGCGSFPENIWNLVHADYSAEKAALHVAAEKFQQIENRRCKITLLRLGIVDVESCDSLNELKISKTSLKKCLDFLFSAGANLEVKSLNLQQIGDE